MLTGPQAQVRCALPVASGQEGSSLEHFAQQQYAEH